jgi:hypothetical protein
VFKFNLSMICDGPVACLGPTVQYYVYDDY